MCGRYTISVSAGQDDKLDLILRALEAHFPGAYQTGEICPGCAAPALIGYGGRVVPVVATFGLPGFEGGRPIINARAETAVQKPFFSESLLTRRIILPATGFFEWNRGGGANTKYEFCPRPREGENAAPVMYLCGLYQIVDGGYRFAILTRAAAEPVAAIHDRMPVMVREDQVRAYLTDWPAAQEIIAGPAPALVAVPAGPAPADPAPAAVAPADPAPAGNPAASEESHDTLF